jgi:hypothetical protein
VIRRRFPVRAEITSKAAVVLNNTATLISRNDDGAVDYAWARAHERLPESSGELIASHPNAAD